MEQCQLTFQIQSPAAELRKQIQKLVEQYDGQLTGDEKSGQFSLQILGSIEGEYTIDGNKLHINITKKPMLIGCETISSTIKTYLTDLA